MAKIGLKCPVAAPITAENSGAAPTYGTGFIIGRAVAANKTINSNDNPLYADDAIAEMDTSFSNGTLEVTVSDFGTDSSDSLTIQANLLGHTVVTEGTSPDTIQVLRKKSGDVAPYLGFGYYKTKKLNGVLMYEATLLYKVQFQLPSENSNTKGENIEWQTPTMTCRIMTLPDWDNTYEETAIFDTESACRTWLFGKLNITENTGG